MDAFERLEAAILARNPLLAETLQPGLPEKRVRHALSRAGIEGALEPIIKLYTWKNGALESLALSELENTLLVGTVYWFINLDNALSYEHSFRGGAAIYPKASETVGRYIPVFWNGRSEWLAVDVAPSSSNRIVHINFKSERPIREIYQSFDDFIAEAISSNERGEPMAGLKVFNGRTSRPLHFNFPMLSMAIVRRNQELMERLQTGLIASDIRGTLSDANVSGNVEAIVQLYSWRNGVRAEDQTAKAAFLPEQIYQFMPLDEAVLHFQGFPEAMAYHPVLNQTIGRYFPAFWDGATGYFVFDLWSEKGAVSLLEFESEGATEVYPSLSEFIRDIARAYNEEDTLICFQMRGSEEY